MTTQPQRISFVALDEMDADTRAEVERCAAVGTPRPESSSVRAHSPEAFWAFANSWEALFRGGVVDHSLKELCRVYVSRSVKCEYCGNQRSEQARGAGLREGALDELMNFETSGAYDERQRAALAYAEAITWRLEAGDALWERLARHFSERELVELGCFVALTLGQQSWDPAARPLSPPGAPRQRGRDGPGLRGRGRRRGGGHPSGLLGGPALTPRSGAGRSSGTVGPRPHTRE